ISTFIERGDQQGFQEYISSLKPVVEQQLGTSVDREISAEMLEAYTTVGGTPQLDGQYTVFGKVIKGLDVIDKIAAAPRDSYERPLEDIRMTITVDEMPRRKIEKTYGYTYPEN
ncbi:MAG TPA: peptidylprolyl isomerase, partial [Chryseosolibacter sp.]|nr:peptidylprolyl isomerase [Chryseosolibacter sp.]